MENFWDYSVWGIVLLFALLLVALLVGNVLRRTIPFLTTNMLPPWLRCMTTGARCGNSANVQS